MTRPPILTQLPFFFLDIRILENHANIPNELNGERRVYRTRDMRRLERRLNVYLFDIDIDF